MEALNRLPWVSKNPIFKRLSEIGEVSALSREERIKYDAAIRIYRDNLYAMEGAEEVGMKKGFEKGRKKGREEGRLEGREEGILEGIEKGIEKGREEGRLEGREEGRLEGREEGIEEGIEKGILMTARKLKVMGVPVHSIAEATGLSVEVIEGL